MIEFDVSLIHGVMLGLEAPNLPEDDINWCIVLDLVFFRFTLISWKRDEH